MEKFKGYVKLSIEEYASLKEEKEKLYDLVNGGTLYSYSHSNRWGGGSYFSMKDKDLLVHINDLDKKVNQLTKTKLDGFWKEFKIALCRIPN